MVNARTSNWIIGGMFGLPAPITENFTLPQFISKDSILLLNARSGIFLLTEILSPPKVWVPSFLCHTVLDGARKAGGTIDFYAVNYDLCIDPYNWIRKVGVGDLVVLIDYFGWPCEKESIDLIKKSGAWVLEDACQAMFSEGVGRYSDFTLVSPRKYLGIPDGAVLTPQNGRCELNEIALSEPPEEWWMKAFAASLLRREFDVHGESNGWYELYQMMDVTHPIGRYAMSQLSRFLLLSSFDYYAIIQRRVNNYRILASRLRDIAIFVELPEGVVPMGFPIRAKKRDEIRQALFKEHIYPPIHWSIRGVVPELFEDSHRLSNEILTLPCDQRYGHEDMEKIAKVVLRTQPTKHK